MMGRTQKNAFPACTNISLHGQGTSVVPPTLLNLELLLPNC